MLFFFFFPPPLLRPACCSETGVILVFYYLVVTCFPGCVSMLSEATQAQVVSLGFASVVLVNWALNPAVLQCTRRCIFLRAFLFSITYLVCCIIILVPLTKYVSITLLIVVPLVFTLFGCAIVCKFLPGAMCCTGCRPSSHTTVHIGFRSVTNCSVSSSSFFFFFLVQ